MLIIINSASYIFQWKNNIRGTECLTRKGAMGILEGKITVVTGAASGIGRSTAEAFGKEGV